MMIVLPRCSMVEELDDIAPFADVAVGAAFVFTTSSNKGVDGCSD